MFNSHPMTRRLALESFQQTLWSARKDAILSKLFKKISSLKQYADVGQTHAVQKRNLGIQPIATNQVTGTLTRDDDFDGHFRPLKRHLRDRWVNIALLFQTTGWPPIEVIKVGEDYFVVDGHHRTSYARSVGMAFIDAEVWEVVQEPPTCYSPIIDAAKELFTKPETGEGIIVYDSIDCCCYA